MSVPKSIGRGPPGAIVTCMVHRLHGTKTLYWMNDRDSCRSKFTTNLFVSHISLYGESIEETTSLLEQFVCMIELDADIKFQLRFGTSKIDVAMAQLIQYNCYTKYRYRDDAKMFSLLSLNV